MNSHFFGERDPARVLLPEGPISIRLSNRLITFISVHPRLDFWVSEHFFLVKHRKQKIFS
jgi:hypothetical protein